MNQLHILSAGTPTPRPGRFGTASVLELDGRLVLIDCGPATTYKLVEAGLWPTKVDWLFFTRHHSDHNADYPCLLMCRWDQNTGSENTLHVRGPTPTARLTDQLMGPGGAFAEDWKARVGDEGSQAVHRNRGGSLPRPEPHFDAVDIRSGETVEGEGFTARAIEVYHAQPFLQSLAYRFDASDVSVVFAGDTGAVDEIAELARGAHTLVVNCWDFQQTMDVNGEDLGQCGTLDAANMAARAGVEQLVVTHTGPALSGPTGQAKASAQIGEIFRGRVLFPHELSRVLL